MQWCYTGACHPPALCCSLALPGRLNWAWPSPTTGQTGSPHTGVAVPAGCPSHTTEEARETWGQDRTDMYQSAYCGWKAGFRSVAEACDHPEPILPLSPFQTASHPSFEMETCCLWLTAGDLAGSLQDLAASMSHWRVCSPHLRGCSLGGGEVVDFLGFDCYAGLGTFKL